MSRLLYIKASPRRQRSKSAHVADALVDAYAQVHPDDEVATLDLFEMDLPAFDGPALDAKYSILHGEQPTAEQGEAWKTVEAVIDQFKAAEKYVLAVPMWNFGIPYRLKHYLDILIQPTYTFAYSPEDGYSGLVTGRPAVVVSARGGDYSDPQAAPLDHEKPYVEQVLGFMGFSDIQSIVVEPTLMAGPDVAEQRIAGAVEQAKAIGAAL